MEEITGFILKFFYIAMLLICVCAVLFATIQFKNSNYSSKVNPNTKKKPKNQKTIIIGIALIIAILFKIMTFNSNSADMKNVDMYENRAIADELRNSLMLQLGQRKDDTLDSADNFALFLNKRLPIKMNYYVGDKTETNFLTKYEVMKYNLDDFEKKPTLVTFDGTLFSIIKFKEGCWYVNHRNIAKSDCVIEVDVNHFEEPNQIGIDRTLFVVDRENTNIIVDKEYFK